MKLVVIYKDAEREIGREMMDVRLAEAQSYADDVVARGIYGSVEIRDEDDRLIGRSPRALRGASDQS